MGYRRALALIMIVGLAALTTGCTSNGSRAYSITVASIESHTEGSCLITNVDGGNGMLRLTGNFTAIWFVGQKFGFMASPGTCGLVVERWWAE